MKQILTTGTFLLLSTILFSQDLTGIWRGSFFNIREVMLGGSRYRYEVQINNKDKAIKGVTYSYQTTRFYGKASLVGVWNPTSDNLVMKEERMDELKIQGGGEGCLMTCYLDYRKEGNREILEGTYTSRNMNNGSDCGGGKVFLEKVPDSDFEKEDFLKDKENKDSGSGKVKPGQEDFLVAKPAPKQPAKPKPATTAKKPTPKQPVKKAQPSIAKTTPKPGTTVKKPAGAPPVSRSVPTVKKPAEASVKKPAIPPVVKKPDTTAVAVRPPETANSESNIPQGVKPAPVKTPPPLVLKQRQNELFETITTSARQISISFYDNGEIDGDTISVYDNNRLLVQNKGLSANPITITVQLDDNETDHEVVMVAQNLGSIPPNTALMIVQAGDQRYTVRLSSNEQKNAMVRFRYQPGAAQK